eukprot:scaffold79850_cov37-Prasinocladus_malaysianus.AAC.1
MRVRVRETGAITSRMMFHLMQRISVVHQQSSFSYSYDACEAYAHPHFKRAVRKKSELMTNNPILVKVPVVVLPPGRAAVPVLIRILF